MAEQGWWGWVNSARAKGAEVLEFVKKDINEISTVVKTEATVIAEHASSAVKEGLQLDKEDSTANTVKKSLSSFFEQLSEALVPTNEDQEVYVPVIVKDGEPLQLTPYQLKLHELTSSDVTYTSPIDDTDEDRFNAWLEVAQDNLSDVTRLTNYLASNPLLQEKYTALVPDKVSHSEFWKRFLFRKAVLEDAEAETKRKEAERKRKEEELNNQPKKDFNWEKEKDFAADVELTEEEQSRILEQYEAEIKNVKDEKKDLKVKEKNDMVIVGSNVTSQASSKDSSTDGDWEKEFEIEEEKN